MDPRGAVRNHEQHLSLCLSNRISQSASRRSHRNRQQAASSTNPCRDHPPPSLVANPLCAILSGTSARPRCHCDHRPALWQAPFTCNWGISHAKRSGGLARCLRGPEFSE
ncbi:hypothetical protein BJY00DRAFT_289076 [Aspergillus carlsbadensis]|nr:hypothetical protein BJY00DRAFT_289076 [Aspergillus carlsbadensis]